MERGRETSSLVELGGLRHLIPAFAEETVAKFGSLTEDFQRRRQGSFPSGAPGRGSQIRKRLAGGGSRFEPSVPLANGVALRSEGKRRSGQTRQSRERSFPHGGTEGSNPAPSSAESDANPTSCGWALSSARSGRSSRLVRNDWSRRLKPGPGSNLRRSQPM